MVSSSIYRSLFLEIRIRSGRRESSVIRDGDRNAGRSAYTEQDGRPDNVFAIKLRTESCLQVYLLCSKVRFTTLKQCAVTSQTEGRENMPMIA